MDPASDLPFVDEHSVEIAAPAAQVWPALEEFVSIRVVGPPRPVMSRLFGLQPASGFAVGERVEGERLLLVGRHRFSRYAFELVLTEPRPGLSRLAARTYAEFPGPRGRAYRAVVIGTRGHVVVVRRILGQVRRAALADET